MSRKHIDRLDQFINTTFGLPDNLFELTQKAARRTNEIKKLEEQLHAMCRRRRKKYLGKAMPDKFTDEFRTLASKYYKMGGTLPFFIGSNEGPTLNDVFNQEKDGQRLFDFSDN